MYILFPSGSVQYVKIIGSGILIATLLLLTIQLPSGAIETSPEIEVNNIIVLPTMPSPVFGVPGSNRYIGGVSVCRYPLFVVSNGLTILSVAVLNSSCIPQLNSYLIAGMLISSTVIALLAYTK